MVLLRSCCRSILIADNDIRGGRSWPSFAGLHQPLLRGAPILLPPIRVAGGELPEGQQRAPHAGAHLLSKPGERDRVWPSGHLRAAGKRNPVGCPPSKVRVSARTLQWWCCRRCSCTSPEVTVTTSTPYSYWTSPHATLYVTKIIKSLSCKTGLVVVIRRYSDLSN